MKLGRTKLRILRNLLEHESHGYEISKNLNIPLTGIYQHLKELTRSNLTSFAVKNNRKIYFLTEKGKKLTRLLEE